MKIAIRYTKPMSLPAFNEQGDLPIGVHKVVFIK